MVGHMNNKALIEGLSLVVDPWLTHYGDVYVTIKYQGKVEVMPLDQKSAKFRGWLYMWLERAQEMTVISKKLIDDLVEYIYSKAVYSGKKHPVNIRKMWTGQKIVYDLGQRQVEVTPEGWQVVDMPDYRFYRPEAFQEQVTPVQGSLDLLKKYIRVKGDGDWYSVLGWLLGCFNPQPEYPVLILNGGQGSSKSTVAGMLKRIVDPNAIQAYAPPKDMRDLTSYVKNSFVISMDNVSYMDGDLSDAFCRLATNSSGLGGRRLYTNDELTAFQAARPIILNGIPSFIERGDIGERSIQVTMPSISPDERMPISTLLKAFEKDLPEILGGLLDVVVVGLREREAMRERLVKLPRMSDFALWVGACARGLGVEPENMVELFKQKGLEANASLVELNGVAQAVITFMKDRKHFTGPLRKLLIEIAPYKIVGEKFPDTAQQFSNQLKRLEAAMKSHGVVMKTHGRDSVTNATIYELILEEFKTSVTWRSGLGGKQSTYGSLSDSKSSSIIM